MLQFKSHIDYLILSSGSMYSESILIDNASKVIIIFFDRGSKIFHNPFSRFTSDKVIITVEVQL